MKQYLIRERCFQYQDDFSAIVGYHSLEIHTDLRDAEQRWFQIEVKNARQGQITYEGEALYCGTLPADSMHQLREIFFTVTGHQGYFPSQWTDCEDYFALLSDEQLFLLLTLSQQNRYELIHYESDNPFYAVWIPAAQQYLTSVDAHTLYYSSCLGGLISDSHVVSDALYHDSNDELLKGSLEQISSTPHLLNALIEAHPQHFTYYPAGSEYGASLSIRENFEALMMISPLLRQPLVEIHRLTPAQIMTLHTLIDQKATHHPNFHLSAHDD